MGLLDQITNAVSGMAGGGQGAQNPLLSAVLGMISNPQSGGLAGLVQQFQQKGLGKEMSSWVGTGQNLPVSGEQITSVLGSDQIAQIAQRLGMSSEQASGGLAGLLPTVIDKLTPKGQLPDQNALSGDLGSLVGKLLSH
jgi:uncharacterized protein YidB (DUF937 family)